MFKPPTKVINKEYNIPFIALSVIFFMLPVGGKALPIAIFLFVLMSLMFGDWSSWKTNFSKVSKIYVPLLLFYSLYIIGFFISDETDSALKQLEHKVSFFLFPFLMPLVKVSDKQRDTLFKLFILGCTMICVVSFLHFFYVSIFLDEYCILGEKPEGNRIGTAIEYLSNHFIVVNVHRTYFSMYLLLAVYYIVFDLLGQPRPRGNKNMKKLIMELLALLMLASVIFCVQSKIIVGLLVVSGIVLPIFSPISIRKKIIFILSFLVLTFAFKETLYSRFNNSIQQIKYILSPGKDQNKSFTNQLRPGSTEIRYILYKSAIQLIEEKPIFGYGTGDVKKVLRVQNEKNKFTSIAHLNYGPHSQVLEVLIGSGIIGFLVLLSVFFCPIIEGIRFKNYFMVAFALAIFFCCLIESFLTRQDGIILTSLFISVFASISKKEHI
ncbi:O-antigen ligase family protein [Flagellimonas sp. HMM57]|uniref:O-antigen ligase family protein n=1 Tax=unclassified Flagellimonas TaxID=2644544 RepID=UPI0013D3F6BB|nr:MULTISPECIES: O-antigen ligase family protein [unclassified Flagellimonas]UII77598.1 O-antigen ligase family protein [Flagellimonas sp. HMM57]